MSQNSSHDLMQSALRAFGRHPDSLKPMERRALERVTQRRLSSEPAEALHDPTTVGDRLADRVARFGGSWTFISLFVVFLLVWALANTRFFAAHPIDPYPFIFLNLLLSMVAALQAPIIMMSQNRQSTKDRLMAGHDYEVNLKAEIEIMALHEKLDSLRSEQMLALMAKQQETLELMTRAMERLTAVHGRICGEV
ncbi:MAG: DUF1003 domain-containing protein [Pseudomonadota bacterium]